MSDDKLAPVSIGWQDRGHDHGDYGILDDNGDLITYDNDSGEGLLSRITGTVPSSGSVIICVTGYDDFGFMGSHSQSGTYTLEVIPEPCSLVLLTLGGLMLIRRRK